MTDFNPEHVMKLAEEYCRLMTERERIAHAIQQGEEQVKVQSEQARLADENIAKLRSVMGDTLGIVPVYTDQPKAAIGSVKPRWT